MPDQGEERSWMSLEKYAARYASSLAIFSLLLTVFIPVEAQVPEYDPASTAGIMNAQGSPRSALDDQRVFLFGDSQVAGAPGAALMHHITAAGATYYARAGEPGWGVHQWDRRRYELNRLLRQHHPTLVVIILGGNDWERVRRANYSPRLQNFWNFVIERTLRHAPHASLASVCWAGPARMTGPRAAELQPGRDLVAAAIRNVVGTEHFVRSNDITGTFGRSRDGLHFTYGGANDWMWQMTPRLASCVERQHPNIRDL